MYARNVTLHPEAEPADACTTTLAKCVLPGTPRVKGFDVANSTFHKIVAQI